MSNTRNSRAVHDSPQSVDLATSPSTSRSSRRRLLVWRVLAVPVVAAIADQNNLESSAEEKAGKVDETVDAALCHK